jgi:hypothetical protein
MLAWLTANPLFPLTCRSAFRNQLSSFEGHRNGLELSQSTSNSALAESGRARVVTKRVVHGELTPLTNKPAGLFCAPIQAAQLANATPFLATGCDRRRRHFALRFVNRRRGLFAHLGSQTLWPLAAVWLTNTFDVHPRDGQIRDRRWPTLGDSAIAVIDSVPSASAQLRAVGATSPRRCSQTRGAILRRCSRPTHETVIREVHSVAHTSARKRTDSPNYPSRVRHARKRPILERRDWRTHCSVDATQPSSLIENSEIRLTPDFGVCQIPVGRDRRDGSTRIQA